MKHATIKYLCLLMIAFSFSSAGAQTLKFPLTYQPVQEPASIKGYIPLDSQLVIPADRPKALLLSRQQNFTIYALPLDGTPCLVSNEPADRTINAWKPESNDGVTATIPNAMEVKPVIPQTTVPFSQLTK